MKAERNAYVRILKELDGDAPGRKLALDHVREEKVLVHGGELPFSYVPYLLNAEDRAFLKEQCEITHRILCKVTERYLKDPSYRELFHFPKDVEKLILLPCGYDQLLPLCRLDFFLNEDDLQDYKFCEFNADGSGAMSRDLVTAEALMEGETFQRFAQGHDVRRFELFDSWVEAFMRIYRSDAHAVEHPTIAITDFAESGVFSDFERFIAAFQRAGYDARFVDTRAFEFDGEHLIDPSDGMAIDAIYRRAVTSELLGHLEECQALIDAVAAEKVCLIGHFRTTVIHSKMVNVALFDKRTREFLSEEEEAFVDAHVPHTYRLLSGSDEFSLEDVKRDKDSWIVKPADDYGAHGVYPGVDFAADEWARIVDEHLDAGYIVQEFYQPHEVAAMDVRAREGEPIDIEPWESMPGIYVYDGKPQGLYCRLGQEGVIALDHHGLMAPSFAVD